MKALKGAGIKQESLLQAHSEVQATFSQMLATALQKQTGSELQCCVTYGKPCGCIRKYILGGENWKEIDNPNLHLRQADVIDVASIKESDRNSLGNLGLNRAGNLVSIYEKASELKKEKCYAFNNVEVEGKTLKELRGMIGLGNGRKRSKKYEDYVLAMRSVLRNEYSLCEKAAQKLLGYSINFLYKKLRTNPQKTSRLVATNKAERASKTPRHLIPLDELREMGRKSNSSTQCCGRNCISRLASQHFDKIENWRRRLEGSGQRVAQEIVAEVLRASSTSLDGQNSFCQNLVHWVTGCSFKKIRRVRDHLKKDPESLPEHGLKKYWKDKAKKQGKSEPTGSRKRVFKREKEDPSEHDMLAGNGMFYSMYSNAHHSIQGLQPAITNSHPNPQFHQNTLYGNVTPPRLTHLTEQGTTDTLATSTWQGTNINNSNNMMMNTRNGFPTEMSATENTPIFGVALVPSAYPQNSQLELKQRGTPEQGHNSCQYQNLNQSQMLTHQTTNNGTYVVHKQIDHTGPGYVSSSTNQSQLMAGQQHNLSVQPSRVHTASPYDTANSTIPAQQYNNHVQYPVSHIKNPVSGDQSMVSVGQGAARSSVILHTAGSQHQQQTTQEQLPPYNRGNVEMSNNSQIYNQNNSGPNDSVNMQLNNYGQHYYIAAPANSGYDTTNFFPSGMAQGLAPFVLSQQNEDGGENKNIEAYNYKQPFYILSPIPAPGEKGLTPNDLQNWKQMPMTPFHLLTPYLPSGRVQSNENEDSEENGWQKESQRFLFPVPFQNAEGIHGNNEYVGSEPNNMSSTEGDNPMQYVPTALTPVAVVQHQGGSFMNLGAQWMGQEEGTDSRVQQTGHYAAQNVSAGDGQQWPPGLSLFKLQQYPPNINLDQFQGQSHVLYEAAQYPQYAQQGVWPSTNENKFVTNAQTVPANSTQTANFSNSSYVQNQVTNQNENNSQILPEDVTDNSDEKEGGIVTPKIIREALSNKFNRVAVSSIHEKEATVSLPSIEGNKEASMPLMASPPNKNSTTSEDPKDSQQVLEPQMPKLAPITSRLGNKQGESENAKTDGELQCASISSRSKRFSRDRLRATIDSPSIVLTPFTPLTPSITPAIIIPDISEDENTEGGKEDGNTSASSTNSQPKEGSIFLFPPTHVSRRRAAIRFQGHTVSAFKSDKVKNPNDSPSTPGPFPVAADPNSPNNRSMTDDSGVSSSTSSLSSRKDLSGKSTSEEVHKKSTKGDKSPALTLRNLGESGTTSTINVISKNKPPVLSLDTEHWPDDTVMRSPVTEDNALNTPTQQLNTPNSQLNTPIQQLDTPTHQLNTPNQDLNTPTESPIKALLPVPSKRKRESSTSSNSPTDKSEDSVPFSSKSSTSTIPSKSLRFHFFTPKDFDDGVNCSAFRKPSEFASAPTDSAIAKRRRRPRKQLNPSSVADSTAEGELSENAMDDVSPDDIYESSEDSATNIEGSTINEKSELNGEKTTEKTRSDKPKVTPTKPNSAGPNFPRMIPGTNILLGNPYDSLQTPSLFQLVTPSFPNSTTGSQPQSAFSSQQVNTPVFLHSATYINSAGSGLVRRVSPPSGAPPTSSGNMPQIFTFMPGGIFTPPVLMPSSGDKKVLAAKKDDNGNSPSALPEKYKKNDSNDGKANTSNSGEEKKSSEAVSPSKKSTTDQQRQKRASMTLALSSSLDSPAYSNKESGLQTPSNLHVVTPSLMLNSAGSITSSEVPQVFTFPSSGAQALYQLPTPGTRSVTCGGGYVLYTPSKTSPTAQKLLYQSVPMELYMASKKLKTDTSENNQAKEKTPKNQLDAIPNSNESTSAKDLHTSAVPVIVVEPPDKESKSNENPDGSGSKVSAPESSHASAKAAPTPPQPRSTNQLKAPVRSSPSTTGSGPSSNSQSGIPMKRKKSTGSPKEYPKPLVMTAMNPDSSSLQVQTPTLIHLISPSQPNPSSPSLMLYPISRPPHPSSSKLSSPLSAGSNTGGTPIMGILQRLNGPGSSSSLLKSALMKNLSVFQFPPSTSQTGSITGASSASNEDSSAISLPSISTMQSEYLDTENMNEKAPGTNTVTGSENPSVSQTKITPQGDNERDSPTSPTSAAVSVICGPRASSSQYSDKLSGPNDPCLSEAAQN